MRKLRHLSLITGLICVLATSGFAGIIPTLPGPEPAPSPSGIVTTPPSTQSEPDPVVELALALLRVLVN
jgi:hypothetical protein